MRLNPLLRTSRPFDLTVECHEEFLQINAEKTIMGSPASPSYDTPRKRRRIPSPKTPLVEELDEEAVGKLTVQQLKTILASYKLPRTGTKIDLVRRVRLFIRRYQRVRKSLSV